MIEIRKLSKKYLGFSAVKNVSLTIKRGEVLGLIGESGCGKSTLAKMLMRLEPPTLGDIFFEGEEITHKRSKELSQKIQIVFQDPHSSLNPLLTVADLIDEPLRIHRRASRVDELLGLVGLPLSAKGRYAHEFSGGQRQRITIARAIALNPEFLICDEPISSLDLSIQMQIVNLLLDIQKKMGLTILFIAHDLPMVRYISDRVAVMKEGEIVECLMADELFEKSKHPESRRLIASILAPEQRQSLYQTPRSRETSDLQNIPSLE